MYEGNLVRVSLGQPTSKFGLRSSRCLSGPAVYPACSTIANSRERNSRKTALLVMPRLERSDFSAMDAKRVLCFLACVDWTKTSPPPDTKLLPCPLLTRYVLLNTLTAKSRGPASQPSSPTLSLGSTSHTCMHSLCDCVHGCLSNHCICCAV